VGLHGRPAYGRTRALGPLAALLVLLTPYTGHAVPLTGAILVMLVGVKLIMLGAVRPASRLSDQRPLAGVSRRD
jgi:hypothetical protein